MMKRRTFLKTGSLAATALLAPAACNRQSGNPDKPNILFIFTDQQTGKAMSCSGNSYLHTPAMDSLAAAGVRFEKSYCTAPVCAPSRSSMITSHMPHETGYDFNLSAKEKAPKIKFVTMGEIFRNAGYNTVWAGKWHLPESYPLRAKSMQHAIPGFDLLPFYDSSKNWPEWGRGDITDKPLADAAVDFISNYSEDNPFLLAVSFCNPHDVCYVPRKPEEFLEPEIKENLPPLPPNFAVDANEPELVQRKRVQLYYGDETIMAGGFCQKEWRRYVYEYYRMTERVDEQIGRVLAALKEKGVQENTLIIFTSDHGDGVAAHKWAAKLSLYEEAVNVPFIISWKGRIPAGVVNGEHLVSGLDILPTMCDYAAIEHPAGFLGKSIRTIIENPQAAWRNFVVTELATDPKDPTWKGRMICGDRYKYNLYSKGARNEQLFDLLNDPGETQNLAFEPAMQAIKSKLKKRLVEWMRQTEDDFFNVWDGEAIMQAEILKPDF